MDYSPWGRKEEDPAEHTCMHIFFLAVSFKVEAVRAGLKLTACVHYEFFSVILKFSHRV